MEFNPVNKPIQEDIFYALDWDENVDNIFIDILAAEAKTENFARGKPKLSAILTTKEAIRKHYGLEFNYHMCMQKLEKIETQYRIFDWLLQCLGVEYCLEVNTVYANDAAWNFILKTNPFTAAYRPIGEPKWAELTAMYTWVDNTKEFNETETLERFVTSVSGPSTSTMEAVKKWSKEPMLKADLIKSRGTSSNEYPKQL